MGHLAALIGLVKSIAQPLLLSTKVNRGVGKLQWVGSDEYTHDVPYVLAAAHAIEGMVGKDALLEAEWKEFSERSRNLATESVGSFISSYWGDDYFHGLNVNYQPDGSL